MKPSKKTKDDGIRLITRLDGRMARSGDREGNLIEHSARAGHEHIVIATPPPGMEARTRGGIRIRNLDRGLRRKSNRYI